MVQSAKTAALRCRSGVAWFPKSDRAPRRSRFGAQLFVITRNPIRFRMRPSLRSGARAICSLQVLFVVSATTTVHASPNIGTILRKNPTAERTSADQLTWLITFDEPVTHVHPTDFVVSGTTATLRLTPVELDEEACSVEWDATLSGGDLPNLNGTVALDPGDFDEDLHDPCTGSDEPCIWGCRGDGERMTHPGPHGTNDNTFIVHNEPPPPEPPPPDPPPPEPPPPEPPTANFSVLGAECAADLCVAFTDTPVTLRDVSTGDVAERSWSTGDGGVSRNAVFEWTWSEPGYYRISLRVSGHDVVSEAQKTLLVRPGDPAGACTPSAEVLCLQDERFSVEAEWRTANGDGGAGRVVFAATNDSGIFWFFDAANWEVLVKLLDGCALNGHAWVFAGATTDLGYVVRVTDTVTNEVRSYRNQAGQPAPATADASAFPCEP